MHPTGLYHIPARGQLLIITSSLKDMLVLKTLGFSSIAPQSENTLLEDSLVKELKSRFTRLLVFMDNDDTGIASNIKHADQYDCPWISIPLKYEAKDISDLRKNYGQRKTWKIIKKLIREAFRKRIHDDLIF